MIYLFIGSCIITIQVPSSILIFVLISIFLPPPIHMKIA
ncbi:unknown [Bacteroides sp. CAG:598]|nr:unknown [Bacteroides sp. CAG:598]